MTKLPAGWSYESINSIVEGGMIADGDWVESKDQDPTGQVRLTQLADVGDGEFRSRSDRWMNDEQASRLNVNYLRPGDLLMARMPDPLGRTCMVPENIGRAVTVVDVAIIRITRKDVNPKFIMWLLNSPGIRQQIEMLASGTTRRRITRKNLGTIDLPMPPIDEQHKIVELLEDHLSRLDAALADVKQAKIKAAQFRMTVLHSIFNSLTNTEDWKSTSLEKIGVWKTGSTPLSKNPEFQGSDVKFVTPGDIGYGGKLNSVARTISSKGADSVRRISPPSVHLVCIGTIGKVAWSKEIVTTNQQINSLEVDASVNNPEFLMWLLASPGIQEKLWSSSSSTTVPILNKGNLEKIQCTLPSLETQNEIMKLIDSLFSKLEAVLETANQLENQSSVLRRSLLQAAFTGQLTKEVVSV